MKKISKIFLSIMLAIAMFANIVPLQAQVVQTVEAETVGKIVLTDHINVFKSGEFTVKTTFKTSQTGLSSLFFLSKGNARVPYLAVYLKNGRIGYEVQPRVGSFEDKATISENLTNNQFHDVEISLSLKNKTFMILVDGNLAHKKDLTQSEVNSLFSSVLEHVTDAQIGTGKRENRDEWPSTAAFKNTTLENVAISDIVFEHMVQNQTPFTSNETSQLERMRNLQDVTFTTTFIGDPTITKSSVLKLANATQEFDFYINPSANSVGVNVVKTNSNKKDHKLLTNHLSNKGVNINDGKVHTLSLVLQKKGNRNEPAYRFYIDGIYVDQYGTRILPISTLDTFTSLTVASANNAAFISNVSVNKKSFNDAEIAKLHQTKQQDYNKTITYGLLTDPVPLFYRGYDNSNHYRIPSLITTKAKTQIAAIDKRQSGVQDFGNIDTLIRRKEVNDTEFRHSEVVLDLVNTNSWHVPHLIDPALVEGKDGTIYMLVDMFPQSRALMGAIGSNPTEPLATGSGYKTIEGKKYLKLFPEVTIQNPEGIGEEYTVREDGIVYDSNNQKTNYRVDIGKYGVQPYNEYGSIYENGEYAGNIFLYTGEKTGKLKAVKTSYLWLIKSTDDGKTWSRPVDITKFVKPEWAIFIGVGPGVGLTLEDGTIAFPIYTTNEAGIRSQASHLITSNDNGETWEIGESPQKNFGFDPSSGTTDRQLTEAQALQLNNGDIYMFMRSHSYSTYGGPLTYAISKDKGKTWSEVGFFGEPAVSGTTYNVSNAQVFESDTQMSNAHFNYNGKEYILHSGPSKWRRFEGTLTLGEVTYDSNNRAIITWSPRKIHAPGGFAYSSISYIGEGKFGLLYEAEGVYNRNTQQNEGMIMYREFDMEYLTRANEITPITDTQIDPEKSGYVQIDNNNSAIIFETTNPAFIFSNPTAQVEVNGRLIENVPISMYEQKFLIFLQGVSNIESVVIKSINQSTGKLVNINNVPVQVENLTLSYYRSDYTPLPTKVKDLPSAITAAESIIENTSESTKQRLITQINSAKETARNKDAYTQPNLELETAKLTKTMREVIPNIIFSAYETTVKARFADERYATTNPEINTKLEAIKTGLQANGSIITRQQLIDEIMKLNHYLDTVKPVYLVHYELEEGTNASENPTVIRSEQAVTLQSPTKSFHNFLGWYIGDTQVTALTNVTEDITVRAKWEKIPPVEVKPESTTSVAFTIHKASESDNVEFNVEAKNEVFDGKESVLYDIVVQINGQNSHDFSDNPVVVTLPKPENAENFVVIDVQNNLELPVTVYETTLTFTATHFSEYRLVYTKVQETPEKPEEPKPPVKPSDTQVTPEKTEEAKPPVVTPEKPPVTSQEEQKPKTNAKDNVNTSQQSTTGWIVMFIISALGIVFLKSKTNKE